MFGMGKSKMLEDQLRLLNDKLSNAEREKTELRQRLEAARRQISDLEAQLSDADLEQRKEMATTARVEYEGMKELYAKKIRDFEAAREEQEQEFARTAAIKRFNLENEIRENRRSNEEYVRDTVKTFGESYAYYMDQIKLLMDALGEAAAHTSETLFAAENADLKASFGQQLAGKLKSDMDTLPSSAGDLLLIGGPEGAEASVPAEEPAEEAPVTEAPEMPPETPETPVETCEGLAAEAEAEGTPADAAEAEGEAVPWEDHAAAEAEQAMLQIEEIVPEEDPEQPPEE